MTVKISYPSTVVNDNDTQLEINRVVSGKRESFSYGEILNDISKAITKKKAPQYIINNSRLQSMVSNTLEDFVETKKLKVYDGRFYICDKNTDRFFYAVPRVHKMASCK